MTRLNLLMLAALTVLSSNRAMGDEVLEQASDVPSESKHNIKLPAFEPYAVDGAAMWEQFTDASVSRWRRSQAEKKGEEGLRYDGEWEIEELTKLAGVEGDKALVVKSEARHHAISAKLDKTFDPAADGLVFQYEVKLQENLGCSGAYAKLLTAPFKGEFSDASPYTIMFGPDKCGESKVHLIFRHKNPITGEYTEHHLDQPPMPPTDHLSHLYTLVIHTNNTFNLLVDNIEKRTGSLLADFVPPVNPPKEIVDETDKKPVDWIDDAEIPDPEAKKPEDWDEDAPLLIPDEEAEMPKGWLEDEPLMVPAPDAEKPADWDDEEDGDWSPPLVPNPKCVDAAGCGPWERPMKRNPDFMGQWSAPMIKNPLFKGGWAPRNIPNPAYFEDLDLYKLNKIDAVGFELWTMQAGISFDNIYLGASADVAARIAKDVWTPKFTTESEVEVATRPKPPPAPKAQMPPILDMFKARFIEVIDSIQVFYETFATEGIISALRTQRHGAFGILMLTTGLGWMLWNVVLVFGFARRIWSETTPTAPGAAPAAASDAAAAEGSSTGRAPAASTATKRSAKKSD